MLMRSPLGVTPVTTCPHCAILIDGTCQVCPPGDPHPSCQDCVDGKYHPPWYKSDLFFAIATSVVVAVASGLIISQIERTWLRRKS